MPKVLIREYDNSTTGIPASDNFAVVVPGYLGETGQKYLKDAQDAAELVAGGTPAVIPEIPLLVENDIYEIKSRSDFDKYIGKWGGTHVSNGEGPTLKIINDISGANAYEKIHRQILVSEFTTAPLEGYSVCEIEYEIDSEDHLLGELYKKNGHLLKTIHYTVTTQVKNDPDDPDKVTDVVQTNYEITIKLKKVTVRDVELMLDPSTSLQVTKSNKYCLVKDGEEGSDKFNTPQIGNQIAYELLGLGYTVLYKRLDPDKSLDGQLCDADFWAPLKDKSVFNFRYVMTGGYYSPSAMNAIIELADFRNQNASIEESETLVGTPNGRGDCIALCDLDEERFNIKPNCTPVELAESMGLAAASITESPYAAIFAPRITYVLAMSETEKTAFNNNATFPASFHYLACAAKTFSKYNEWYAVAGYNRGVSKYTVAGTSVKVGEILVNTLAPRVSNQYTDKSINLILHERGNYYLWGNRTAYKLNTNGVLFHHFLNIRQLCCSIKKQLYTACRQFTFDPNSDLLWINFVNAIKPTLEAMRADQGIKGYTISRVANNKKALLTARIRIVPIEAVEDFDISIYLEDSLTGIIVSADEELA